MSTQLGKIISLILRERFGPVVEKVGTYLFQFGTTPLLYVIKSTEFPISKVKEALCVLIKYRLVEYAPNKNENIANYTLIPENVLLMLRFPKYINLIKKKFGDESEMILEELLQRSYSTASEIILKVVDRLRKVQERAVTLTEIRDKFMALVTAKYVFRVPMPVDEERPVPKFEEDAYESAKYVLPNVDVKTLSLVNSGQVKIEDLKDTVLFTVHFDRFHQDMRDKLIVDAFTNKLDENAGEFVRILLQQMYIRTEPWADISNPIPVVEIKDILRKKVTHPNLVAFFDQYVSVVEKDNSQLIRKAGEASGGSVQIFMKEVFIHFAWETIEQVVMEKYDSKAARIFRLVKTKKYIEPDQIQQLAMIPAKEAKRLSYQLLEENFLQLQELKKPASNNGPVKCFTLFHIHLEKTVRMILELCYKTLFNILTRKNHERLINKRLIDKKLRVDTITMGMRAQNVSEEQLADIEDMITPPEKEMLEKIDTTMKKLNTIELEIDDTIFLLDLYLKYQKMY